MSHSSDISTEESIRLLTVGIDIGSATSQVVFSRLRLEKVGSRYVVVERSAAYESDVVLTPYDGDTIDGTALRDFVDEAYRRAGIDPTEVDTGALIVTGVALDRDNAQVIGEVFADEAGKFVTVTAGDSLESIMSAFGSGAVEASLLRRETVLNIDVGGGTTKLALCRNGAVESAAAVDAGARLITTDMTGAVTGVELGGAAAAARVGLDIQIGQVLTSQQIEVIAADLADCVLSAIRPNGLAKTAGLRTEPLDISSMPAAITFSGGVSEYIYGREARVFGDLGRPLGLALAGRIRSLDVPLLPPTTGIRATVLGVSQYAVQVSGSTISRSSTRLLPLRSVPVAGPPVQMSDVVDEWETAASIKRRLIAIDRLGPVALPVVWTGSATYDRLDAFCRGLTRGFDETLAADQPVVIVFDQDVAQLVGDHLELEMQVDSDIVCIDCVELRQFDFIDIGEQLDGTAAVPVVIKSLVFGQTQYRSRN